MFARLVELNDYEISSDPLLDSNNVVSDKP